MPTVERPALLAGASGVRSAHGPAVIDPSDDRLEARERSLRRVALFWILLSVAAIVAAIVLYFVGVDWLVDFARGPDAAIVAG